MNEGARANARKGGRGKGRLRESLGALTDNKRQKDKGRLEQAMGSTMKRADRVIRRVGRR